MDIDVRGGERGVGEDGQTEKHLMSHSEKRSWCRERQRERDMDRERERR